MSERLAAEAFNRQAPVFDSIYGKDEIIRYKRNRVWEHMAGLLKPGAGILELNAGTGEDAVHFAQQGYSVHATDISEVMQQKLQEKIALNNSGDKVSTEICSFTELENLKMKGPYDHIFSNFAGLNCTQELGKVLSSLKHLLKPGGYVTLVILPKFCLWEFLLLFRGRFKTAFRRFSGKKGTAAHIEGMHFRCWYYNPSFVRKRLKDSFEVVKLEGLCTIVPPSYIRDFATKHAKWYRYLVKKENKMKTRWPWRSIGDYYIISLRKIA
jgi:ubiquinone/menaquinone biosynthesis C-methylase UbiE